MSSAHKCLSDIHILGDKTRCEVVRVADEDKRDWLSGSAVCPLLAQRNILHVGIMEAKPPFEIVRTDRSGTFFLACFEGQGSILVDGEWKVIGPGTACLLPSHTVNALRTGESSQWSFAWVRYLEPRGSVVPVATANSPASSCFSSTPIKLASEGLVSECREDDDGGAAIRNHWVELIHSYVLRFARPLLADDRIWKAWDAVESDLGRNWTLDEIAHLACLSTEHLRRLCLKQIGRSPKKHLTFLSMRHAAELLSATDEKIETIAHSVGYENPSAFSTTFLKWTGIRPSEHR